MIIAEGINEAWLRVLAQLDSYGVDSSPRGHASKELLNVSVKILNPRKRILSLPIRKISLPYAFGEFIWYLSGSNKLDVMQYYSANMKHFSDDGETLNSAYGYRIFGNHPDIPFDQWNEAYDKLVADNDTRQAIIHLHTPNNAPTKDEVCTLTLQFLIRNGRLDMVVNMRSNDIVKGFTYDVFSFTSLQELMANEIGIGVGSYYHNAASMHIYKSDYSYLEEAISTYNDLMYMTRYDLEFSYNGMVIGNMDFDVMMRNEQAARTGGKLVFPKNEAVRIITDVMHIYSNYKNGGYDITEDLKYDNVYHCMMRAYFYRKTSIHDSQLVIVEGCEAAGKTTFTYNNGVGFDIIHFGKPEDNFDKLVYFHTALFTGNIMLDRFFYSEVVYSAFYDRRCMINENDIAVLESLLNYRDARLKLLDTDSEKCYARLNEADSLSFSNKDIKLICNLYKLTLNESLLYSKEVI